MQWVRTLLFILPGLCMIAGAALVYLNYNRDRCDDRTWCGEPAPVAVGWTLVLGGLAARVLMYCGRGCIS
jgi:hypothetical protein